MIRQKVRATQSREFEKKLDRKFSKFFIFHTLSYIIFPKKSEIFRSFFFFDRSLKCCNFSPTESILDRLKVFSIANCMANTLVMSISLLLDQKVPNEPPGGSEKKRPFFIVSRHFYRLRSKNLLCTHLWSLWSLKFAEIPSLWSLEKSTRQTL